MMKLRLKNNLDKNKEKELSNIMTAAMEAAIKCTASVSPLLHRYHHTSMECDRSDIEHRIRKIYRKALRGVCPRNVLEHSVKLCTRFALHGVYPDCADFGHSIVLYCQILTTEALSALKQMIDSGELPQLFSEMFSLFADTTIEVYVSFSVEEYDTAYQLLTSTAGKATCFDIKVIIARNMGQSPPWGRPAPQVRMEIQFRGL